VSGRIRTRLRITGLRGAFPDGAFPPTPLLDESGLAASRPWQLAADWYDHVVSPASRPSAARAAADPRQSAAARINPPWSCHDLPSKRSICIASIG
jgi:hypothetical protein